jgi:glycine cleavage system aminomethyltransferase T
VSALAFLSPDGERSEAADLLARTPMERLARAAGARLERRDRWMVAVAFGEPAAEAARMAQSVGFTDRSSLVKLEVTAPADVIGGLALRPGVAERRDDAWWCPVTPERVLVLGEPGAAAELGRAAEAVGGRVLDVTCGWAALALVGPQCRELLARFCAIDVRPAISPVASFRPGSVARTPGYVLVESADRLLIMVGWALGQFLYEVVADAAEHLGGGPVGLDALLAAPVAPASASDSASASASASTSTSTGPAGA